MICTKPFIKEMDDWGRSSKIRDGRGRGNLTTHGIGTVATTMNEVLLLLHVWGEGKADWMASMKRCIIMVLP
jgi:hypothetical protein